MVPNDAETEFTHHLGRWLKLFKKCEHVSTEVRSFELGETFLFSVQGLRKKFSR